MSVKTLPKSKTIRNPQQFSAATAQARQNVNAQPTPKPTATQTTTNPKATALAPKTDAYVKSDSKALGYGVEKPVDSKALGYGVEKPVDSKALGYGVPTKVGTQPALNSKLSSGYGVAIPVQNPGSSPAPRPLTSGNSDPKASASDSKGTGNTIKGYADVLSTSSANNSKPVPKGYADVLSTSSANNSKPVPKGYADVLSTSSANNSKPVPKGYADVLSTSSANNSKPVPKGYADVLSTSSANNSKPVPKGYADVLSASSKNKNASPITLGSAATSTVPERKQQISEPRSSTVEQVKQLQSKQGKTGQDAVADPDKAPPRELQGHLAQEKSAPSRKGVVDGKVVEIRDKPWQKESGRGTQYMDDKQAAEHKVGFQPVEQDVNGQANARLTQNGKPLKDGEQIFVMDPKKDVYGANSKDGVNFRQFDEKTSRPVDLHHSSFKRGEAVEGAGGLQTRADGTLKKIDDGSGHYQPKPENTLKTMNELEKKGVNLDNTQFEMIRGRQTGAPVETKGMANELRQGGGSESTFTARHGAVDEMNNQKNTKSASEMSKGAQMFGQARADAANWTTTKKDVQAKLPRSTTPSEKDLSPVQTKPLTSEEKAKGYI